MRRIQSSGFTLIELVVTLLVVVVLALLTIPSFSDLIDKSRLRGATDDIVSQLNYARISAVRLQHDVNVSMQVTSQTDWCSGATGAANPTSVGAQIPGVAACDCSATTPACLVGGQSSIVSSADYSKAQVVNVSSDFKNANGGVTFNSKFGTMDMSSLPINPLVKLKSPTGKYEADISVSPLGQVSVCVPSSSPFVSGYPSC